MYVGVCFHENSRMLLYAYAATWMYTFNCVFTNELNSTSSVFVITTSYLLII